MPRPPGEEQFTSFVHLAWPGLYRTAYLLLGDHAEAEDLVQTALARTYATWSRVREPGAAPAYARTVLVNTAASWFRKRSWRNERPTPELPDRGYLPAGADERPDAALLGISEGTVKSQTSDALGRLRGLLGDSVETVEPMDSRRSR